MFKGEKTLLFWAGLLILSLACVFLFSIIWSVRYYTLSFNIFVVNNVPVIVGATVFILIGLYMMKSGVKKSQT